MRRLLVILIVSCLLFWSPRRDARILGQSCLAFPPKSEPRYVLFTAPNGQPARWAKFSLAYAFSDNTPDFAKVSFSRAYAQWNHALVGLFTFSSCTASDNYDIFIVWDDTGALFPPPVATAVGATALQFSGQAIIRAQININAKEFVFHTGAPLGVTAIAVNGQYPVDIDGVSLHEAGHALGMAHSDLHPELIQPPGDTPTMNSVLVAGTENLHQDDITGIRALYGVTTPILTEYDELKAMLIGIGAGPQDVPKLKPPRPLKPASKALSVGKAVFYFDANGKYLGSSASGRVTLRF